MGAHSLKSEERDENREIVEGWNPWDEGKKEKRAPKIRVAVFNLSRKPQARARADMQQKSCEGHPSFLNGG